jgi:hypothetical protein
MKHRIVIALIFLATLSGITGCDEPKSSQAITLYKGSIASGNSIINFVNYEDPIPNGYPKSKKIYLESDCHQGQVKTILFTFTSEPMGKGDVLAENNQSFSPWRYVQPDTIDAALFNVSCRSKISAQGVSNGDVPEDSETLDEDEEVLDEAADNQ